MRSTPAENRAHPSPRHHKTALLAVIVTLGIVFHFGYQVSAADYFPRGFDQIHHRLAAINIAERATSEGLTGFFSGIADNTLAQGFVHITLGSIGILAGVDPTYPIFATFLASLWLIYWSVSERWAQPWRGWLAISLVLAMNSLNIEIGSAIDFRADFIGQTLWTAATALALSSHCFRDRRFTILAGIILAIAFCARSLTVVYAVTAAPTLIAAAWFGGTRDTRRKRLTNLGLGAAIAVALTLPFFIACYGTLKHYYVDNHLSQAEIEARGSNGSFVNHVLYYWNCAHAIHLGKIGKGFLGLMLLVGLVYNPIRSTLRNWPSAVIGLSFCTPIFVMSMGPHKNFIVAGVFSGSVMLLALIPWLGQTALFPNKLRALITISLLIWPVSFTFRCHQNAQERNLQQHQVVWSLIDTLIAESDKDNRTVVSTLHLIEGASAHMVRLRSFAKDLGSGQRFESSLGDSIYRRPSRQAFFDQLLASDFAIYWVGRSSEAELPSNLQVDEYREEIERVLGSQFRRLSPDDPWLLEGHPLELYAR